MTQVNKTDISKMAQEDEKYSRGEHKNKHKHKQIQHFVKEKAKSFNLNLLRGASPKLLKVQFSDSFDD